MHWTVLVVGENFEKQLEPFSQCDRDGGYRGGMWDWYVLGGRWIGALKLKEGAVGKLGRPGTLTSLPTETRVADQARKGDVDWNAMPEDWRTFAILKDGEWLQQSEAFERPYADREAEWKEKWKEVFETISDDTLVSVVDCHS